MRTRSIVGPLILIAIGGLFLANNLRPDLSLIDMLGRYWPYLLILWGSLRLVEVLWSYGRGNVTSYGVSGGEWTLIVFLCLIGSGFFFARQHFDNAPWMRVRGMELFGEPFDYAIEEKKVSADKTVRVIVENFRGNSRIIGNDGSEVTVSGRKTVRALKQNDADEANRVSSLEVIPNGNTILIRTNQEKWHNDRYLSADLEIAVPKGATVEARGRYGDFDISEIEGNVEVTSDNAGVRVQNIGGNLRTDLRRSDLIRAVNVKGDVELKGRGNNVELDTISGQVAVVGTFGGELEFRNLAKPLRYEGPQTNLRVEAIPGRIRLTRSYLNGDDVVGPIVLTSRSKDVHLTGFSQSVSLTLERGDIELRPIKLPTAKMDVTTRSGDIELAIPEGAKFSLNAVVNKGEMQNDFGSPLQLSNEGRGATLAGRVGEGPEIALNSDRGSVTVRKASGADVAMPTMPSLPPMPPMPPRDHRGPPNGRRDRANVEEIVDRHVNAFGRHMERIGEEIEKRAKDRN